MENQNRSVYDLRDQQTGLDPDPSGADNTFISSCTALKDGIRTRGGKVEDENNRKDDKM